MSDAASNPADTSAKNSPSPLVRWSVRLGLAAIAGWLLLGFISIVLLHFVAPISEQDLAMTSWLGNVNQRTLDVGLMVGSAAILVLSGGYGVASGSHVPAFSGILISALLAYGWTPAVRTSIGVLQGEARIGCYELASVQCLEKLKLDVKTSSGAPRVEESSNPSAPVATTTAGTPLPVVNAYWGVLAAPLYLGQGAKLAAILKQQREVAAEQRKALMSTPLQAMQR